MSWRHPGHVIITLCVCRIKGQIMYTYEGMINNKSLTSYVYHKIMWLCALSHYDQPPRVTPSSQYLIHEYLHVGYFAAHHTPLALLDVRDYQYLNLSMLNCFKHHNIYIFTYLGFGSTLVYEINSGTTINSVCPTVQPIPCLLMPWWF